MTLPDFSHLTTQDILIGAVILLLLVLVTAPRVRRSSYYTNRSIFRRRR